MISNRLTTNEVNCETEKYANDIQYLTNRNIKYDDNIISTATDSICQKASNQSTHVAYHLLSKSKRINQNSNSKNPTIHNQLDAINFLQDYLENGDSEILIDLLYDIARELNHNQTKNSYLSSAINNNHLDLTSMFDTSLQLSNNKEKKNKKEKKEDKKKEETDDDTISKKPKKSKEKTKKVEETLTTDSDSIANSPSSLNPIHRNLNSPKSPSYSPTETSGFLSLSIPVPHSGVIPPDSSRNPIPQQSNIAQLSQVQHQLQTDPQTSSLNKTTIPHNSSIQEQLQALSQMAHDGDEVLITLSVNALTQKQEINNNNNSQYNLPSFQNNLYSSQPWNQIVHPSTGVAMPRNVEIVAKGFARVQNEHPQPPSDLYPQPSAMPSNHQLPFVPRYPMPCYSNSGPPQIPIGPPIRPIFTPPHRILHDGFNRLLNNVDFMPHLLNNFDNVRDHSPKNSRKCDYLCQSSLNQPDFRGRPAPNQLFNSYSSPMNFSAQHKTKTKSKQQFSKI